MNDLMPKRLSHSDAKVDEFTPFLTNISAADTTISRAIIHDKDHVMTKLGQHLTVNNYPYTISQLNSNYARVSRWVESPAIERSDANNTNIQLRRQWVIDEEDISDLSQILTKIAAKEHLLERVDAKEALAAEKTNLMTVESSHSIYVSIGSVGIILLSIAVGLHLISRASGIIYMSPIVSLSFAIAGITFSAMEAISRRKPVQ